MSNFVTFKHMIAGSVFHYQKKKAGRDADAEPVKTITFAGPKGGVGIYTTDVQDEIDELRKLARNPQVQIEEETTAETANVITKPAAPEVAIPSSEVMDQAASASDPKTVAAQENLAKLLAGTSSK